MIRHICVFIAFITLSCAGTLKKESPQPPVPPNVSGELKLTFIGTFGNNLNIKSPWGISFGIDGTLYVCDRDNSSIIRVDREGNVISRFNGFDSRTERLFLPIDVSVSGGIEIYALDGANSRVLRFDRNLKNAYAIYKPDPDENKLFSTLSGIVFDKTSGDLFITDRNNGTVIRIDMLGGNIHTAGGFGSEQFSFRDPAGLDVASDGKLFIADREYGAVAVLHHFGAEIRFIGKGILEAPVDVALLPEENIAVADRRGIMLFSSEGISQALAGYGMDREMNPRAVAYSDGKLYISDAHSASILVYKIDKTWYNPEKNTGR